MRVTYTDQIKEGLSKETLAELGIKDRYGDRSGNFMTTGMSKERAEKLIEEVKALGSVKGSKVFIGAVAKHIQILDGKTPKASGAVQMETLLKRYLALEVPNQTLYRFSNERYYGIYVNEVKYHPPEECRDGSRTPASVDVKGSYVHMGSVQKWSQSWTNALCYTTPAALLADEGLFIETGELKAEQDGYLEKYLQRLRVGDQFLTSGWGHRDRGYSYRENNNDAGYLSECFDLGVGGSSTVVVDVVNDSDSSKNKKDLSQLHYVNDYMWRNLKAKFESESNGGSIADVDADWELEESENDNFTRLPVHHLIPVFDLGRHNTFTVHAEDLVPYPWDTAIFEKLVIPDSHKHLIHTLSQSGDVVFKDLIKGKSGGINVLLTGKPGTGKTLTAEIFAESTMRPLYRVHCSQLGTSPDSMENELMDVFRRAARWDAIILLDEADVYIRERGEDLDANAIVGVFLRVLEYQTSVLFMTTNLPDSVDDAIASRCVARIDYTYPDKEDLAQIWRILSEGAGMAISEETIEKVTEWFPMTGRDVKNTLKLIQTSGAEVNFDTINAASSFHPNRGSWNLKSGLPKPDTSLLFKAIISAEDAKGKRTKTQGK
jgi:hypothetical protein